jgi:hypothetical protein
VSLHSTGADESAIKEAAFRHMSAGLKVLAQIASGLDLPADAGETLGNLKEAAGSVPVHELVRLLPKHPDYEGVVIDPEPLASGKVGQVHRARLRDGRELALKFVKPGVAKELPESLERIAEFFEKHAPSAVFIRSALSAMSKRAPRETNLSEELANTLQMSASVSQQDNYRMLQVVPELSNAHVMASRLETLHGFGEGKNEPGVALRGYLRQLFCTPLAHGDLHSGNVKFDSTGKLVFLDAGLAVALTEEERDAFRYTLLGLIDNDHAFAKEQADRLMSKSNSAGLQQIMQAKTISERMDLMQKIDLGLSDNILIVLKSMSQIAREELIAHPRLNLDVLIRREILNTVPLARDQERNRALCEMLQKRLPEAKVTIGRWVSGLTLFTPYHPDDVPKDWSLRGVDGSGYTVDTSEPVAAAFNPAYPDYIQLTTGQSVQNTFYIPLSLIGKANFDLSPVLGAWAWDVADAYADRFHLTPELPHTPLQARAREWLDRFDKGPINLEEELTHAAATGQFKALARLIADAPMQTDATMRRSWSSGGRDESFSAWKSTIVSKLLSNPDVIAGLAGVGRLIPLLERFGLPAGWKSSNRAAEECFVTAARFVSPEWLLSIGRGERKTSHNNHDKFERDILKSPEVCRILTEKQREELGYQRQRDRRLSDEIVTQARAAAAGSIEAEKALKKTLINPETDLGHAEEAREFLPKSFFESLGPAFAKRCRSAILDESITDYYHRSGRIDLAADFIPETFHNSALVKRLNCVTDSTLARAIHRFGALCFEQPNHWTSNPKEYANGPEVYEALRAVGNKGHKLLEEWVSGSLEGASSLASNPALDDLGLIQTLLQRSDPEIIRALAANKSAMRTLLENDSAGLDKVIKAERHASYLTLAFLTLS